MEQTKHTPGPWKAVKSATEHIDNEPDYDVFADHAEPGLKLPCICVGPNAEANAALVASAPDLLEALYQSYEVLSGILEDTDGDDGDRVPNPLLVEILAALKAAGVTA